MAAGAVVWFVHDRGASNPTRITSPPGTSTTLGVSSGGAVPYEMISSGHLHSLILAGLSPGIADYFFNTPNTLLNMGANGKTLTSVQVARVHQAYPLASIGYLLNSVGPNTLTGAPGIHGLLSGGPLPGGLSYIQYDPEGPGNGTPAAETAALEAGNTSYVKQAAAALAQAHGLKFVFTPSVDAGMTSREGAYPTKYATWLAQDRGAWAAIPGVSVYSIQSQQAEGTPTFATFVPAALAQAHAAAPKTPVDIGIGINPSNPPTVITAADIMNSYLLGQSDGAAGYWYNVEIGVGANVPTSVYVTFFQQLYTQLHG